MTSRHALPMLALALNACASSPTIQPIPVVAERASARPIRCRLRA